MINCLNEFLLVSLRGMFGLVVEDEMERDEVKEKIIQIFDL